jgi:hypothetical protein
MHDFRWIRVPLQLHVTKTVLSYVVKATEPALLWEINWMNKRVKFGSSPNEKSSIWY